MSSNNRAVRSLAAAGLTVGMLCGAIGAAPAAVAADSHSHAATGWTMLGKWRKGTLYHIGDVVRYRGRTYVAVEQNKVKPRGSKKWKRVASSGASGGNGTPGIVGPSGPVGPTGASGPTGATGQTPTWWLADSRGTILGEFLGTIVINKALYQVLYDGGVWWYIADGSYGQIGQKVRNDDSALFTDDQCQTSPYLAANSEDSLAEPAEDAGGMYRMAYSVASGFAGYRIPAGASVTPHSGNLYYWQDDDQNPDTPRLCTAAGFDQDHFLLPLQVTQLPPVAVGGFHAVAG